MTHINNNAFDELAQVLKHSHAGNALILQIADVLNRHCRNFRREWWCALAGYEAPPSPVEVKKANVHMLLSGKMKVIPISSHRGEHGNDPVLDPGWDEISADDPLDPDAFRSKDPQP